MRQRCRGRPSAATVQPGVRGGLAPPSDVRDPELGLTLRACHAAEGHPCSRSHRRRGCSASSPPWWSSRARRALVYPLREVAPVVSLGVVYLRRRAARLDVLGRVAGHATAVASALAFNFFHIPPTGRFTIADGENWVALAVFLIVAVIASSSSRRSRARAAHRGRAAPPRGGPRRRDGAAAAARRRARRGAAAPRPQRLAAALGLPSAAIELRAGRGRRAARRVPAARGRPRSSARWSCRPGCRRRRCDALQERIVPAPRGAAGGRARARRAAAPRSSRRARCAAPTSLKTALLRAVSHDLRSPLTAIVAAGEALASPTLDRRRSGASSAAAITDEAHAAVAPDRQPARPLAAGGAAPPSRGPSGARSRRSIARRGRRPRLPAEPLSLALDRDLPLVRADAAQLERAFANLLENAPRHSGGHPGLGARARRPAGGCWCGSSTAGPGSRRPSGSGSSSRSTAPAARAPATAARASGWRSCAGSSRPTAAGSGSSRCPGQGTSFVVELPAELPPARRAGPDATRRDVSAGSGSSSATTSRRSCARCAWCCATPASRSIPRRPPPRRSTRPPCARRTRRSSTSCCPTATASRSAGQLREWTRDADHRAVGGRRGGAEGARARGRRRRLRDQAVRRARARRAPAGGAAPRRAGAGRAGAARPTGSRSTSPPTACTATARRST